MLCPQYGDNDHDPMAPVHDPRVELRPWTRDDAETFAVLFDDPLVYQFTPIQAPFDVSAAERRIEIGKRVEAQDRLRLRAITLNGVPAGEVAVYRRDETSGPSVAGISYVVGVAFRRGGIARKAVALMIEDLRHSWHVDLLIADISPDNPASQRVAGANGFKPTIDAEPVPREGKVYSTVPWTLTYKE